MTTDIAIVYAILVGAILVFLSGRVRLDVTAVAVIVLLALSGILTPSQAVAGFGNPLVVLIAGLFVVGEGLARTGMAAALGRAIASVGGTSESRIIVLLMPAVALLSAFMSSTGAVAIFIPIVLSMAHRANVAPGRLLMPVAIAALIGGMLTLIGTPPNVAVSTALLAAGLPPFGFFDFSPIGAAILIVGLGYVLMFGHRLLPDRSDAQETAHKSLRDLATAYGVVDGLHRLRVEAASPLVGQSVDEHDLRHRFGVSIIAIERKGRVFSNLEPNLGGVPVHAGDNLICYGPAERVREACAAMLLSHQGFPDGLQRRFEGQFGAAECLVIPESRLVGRRVEEIDAAALRGTSVLSIRRGDTVLPFEVADTVLKAGDMLLLVGPWLGFEELSALRKDLALLEIAREQSDHIRNPNRGAVAVAIIAVMLGLMTFNAVPATIAVLMAAMAMVVTRCVSMTEAYRAMSWQSLILIGGMLPLADALQITGGAELIARQLAATFAEAGPLVLLAGMFAFTSLFSQFISNTATTVLVAPIALTTAADLGLSPEPFLMAVAIAASTAFATPIASPVNTLVLGPGRYTFMDFVRVGVPLQILALAVSLTLIPVFFPFG